MELEQQWRHLAEARTQTTMQELEHPMRATLDADTPPLGVQFGCRYLALSTRPQRWQRCSTTPSSRKLPWCKSKQSMKSPVACASRANSNAVASATPRAAAVLHQTLRRAFGTDCVGKPQRFVGSFRERRSNGSAELAGNAEPLDPRDN